jgi:hypothetical protein
MILKRLPVISAVLALALFFSCSKAEPEILYGFIELVYYPGRTRPEERFSFFILPQDDDGVENLSELTLYHDREGLRWLFSSNDWIMHEEDGKTWIGSRNIAMFDDAFLPRGQFRAVLVNKGGESTERKFTFDGPETPPYSFPVFSLGEGTYSIDSQYPVNRFICYDQQGNAIQTAAIPNKDGNIRDLRLTNTVRTIALWAEDSNYRISALTEAIAIR